MTYTKRIRARGARLVVLVLLTGLAAGGCGVGGGLGTITPEELAALGFRPSDAAFAYDTTGAFPQTLGTIRISNGTQTRTVRLEVRCDGLFLTASPTQFDVTPGATADATLRAQQCPPEPVTVELRETAGGQVRTSTLTVVDGARRQSLAPVATLYAAMLSTDLANPFMETLAVSPLGVPVPHPDIRVPARVPSSPHTEIGSFGYFLGRPPQLPDGSPLFTFRVGGAGPSEEDEEEYVAYWLATMGTVALTNATLRYAGGFCLDSDGDAANNYVPPAQFMHHVGAGTDLWYGIDRKPGLGWSLTATSARFGVETPVPTRAVALVMGAALALLVPKSELGGQARAYRAFAQEYDEAMGPTGALPWSADVAPLVSQGLRSILY